MRRDPAGARERARPGGRGALGTGEPGPLDAGVPLRPRRQGHVDSAADAPRAAALISPRERIAHAIKSAGASRAPALLAYRTAGYPQRQNFREQVRSLAAAADVAEAGVAFTEPRRLARRCPGSKGCVYAATMTGTTGKNVAVPDAGLAYLGRVRASSPIPLSGGFGSRGREQVERVRGHVDGVVVGSALVE